MNISFCIHSTKTLFNFTYYSAKTQKQHNFSNPLKYDQNETQVLNSVDLSPAYNQ